MNVKDKIGARIAEARKEARLTIQGLSNLTGDLKPARISNWEQGLRTPGPDEITKLSKILNVSAAYLMCLSDRKEVNYSSANHIRMLPVYDDEALTMLSKKQSPRTTAEIPVDTHLAESLGDQAFAYKLIDNSMQPTLYVEDMLLCDPNIEVKPGDIALFVTDDSEEPLVRKFRDCGKNNFELIASNEDWPSLQYSKSDKIKLAAKLVQIRRDLK